MKIFRTFCFLLFLGAYCNASSQVNLSGFFQTSAQYKMEKIIVMGDTTNPQAPSFQLQQANLIANSDLGSGFSGYLNIEMTNSMNTFLNFGGISVEDAFVKYNHSENLNFKIGYFTPRFNSFSEIYNKFPLIPYIIRPFFYEKAWAGMVPPEDVLPQKSFFQMYGFLPMGGVKIDYSLFIGNPENSFLLKNGEDPTAEPGVNNSKYVTVGGRVGVRHDNFTLGVSVSQDKDKLSNLNPALPDLHRTRIGADFLFEYGDFTLNSEMISVTYDAKNEYLAAWGDWLAIGKKPEGMNKLALFVTANYDISDRYFVYASYNQFTDQFSPIFLDGLKGPFVGAGIRFNEHVVLKTQYEHSEVKDGLIQYNGNILRMAVSAAL